jgi:hypothetical protein
VLPACSRAEVGDLLEVAQIFAGTLFIMIKDIIPHRAETIDIS